MIICGVLLSTTGFPARSVMDPRLSSLRCRSASTALRSTVALRVTPARSAMGLPEFSGLQSHLHALSGSELVRPRSRSTRPVRHRVCTTPRHLQASRCPRPGQRGEFIAMTVLRHSEQPSFSVTFGHGLPRLVPEQTRMTIGPLSGQSVTPHTSARGRGARRRRAAQLRPRPAAAPPRPCARPLGNATGCARRRATHHPTALARGAVPAPKSPAR